jgi:hypothetical protein
VRALGLSLALGLALASPAAAGNDVEPTNEDVVRRFVTSPSRDEVIRWLDAASRCRFDLSPEGIQELQDAGLPGPVLDAMRRCDRRGAVQAAPASRQPAGGGFRGSLVLAFEAPEAVGEEKNPWKNGYAVPADFPDQARPERFVPPESMALYVACLTPEHVPDHWRGASPVNGDTARRHRMLHFHEEASRFERRPVPLLALILSGEIEAAVPTGEHHLELGVAMKVGGRWEVVERADLGPVTFRENAPVGYSVELRTRKRRTPGPPVRPGMNVSPLEN